MQLYRLLFLSIAPDYDTYLSSLPACIRPLLEHQLDREWIKI